MSEETKQDTSEQPTDEPQPVSLDDLMDKAPIVPQGPPPVKEEGKVAEESEKTSESDKKEEDKTVEPESKTEPKTESKEEPKKEKETDTETKELTGEQKEWKESHDNKTKWQGELTRKSQVVNKYSDEDIINIQAELKLKSELAKVKPDPLPEFIEYEVGKDDVTDEPIKYKLPTTELQKIVDRELEKAKEVWVKEMGPVLAKGEQAVQEAQGLRNDAESNTALVGINKYFDDFPNSKMDLGKDPIQALNDINEAGDTHPEFDKLLNLRMVADRSKAKGITMKEAHIEIFGMSDQEKLATQELKKEQQLAIEEKPG